jgi:hypothetical protein
MMTSFGGAFLLALFLNIGLASKILVSISFPTILLFIIMNKILNKHAVSFNLGLAINYISIAGIIIAIISSFTLISSIFLPESQSPAMNFLYLFFIIISILSPLYLVLIAFSFPISLTFRTLKKRLAKGPSFSTEDFITNKRYLKRSTRFFLLSLIVILSIAVSAIPHLIIVDDDTRTIGTDTKYYVKFLEAIANSSGYEEVFYKAFVTVVSGDRPISLLFFYWLSSMFYQSNFSVSLESLPFLLSPLLVLSSYFLTFYITRNYLTSIFASLIAIPSHILIGMYAGLYANWFALFWGYIAFIFLFKLIENPKKVNLLIFSVMLIVVLFSHAQTWTIFMYIIGLFTAVLFFKNKRENKKGVLYILFAILPSVLIDVLRLFLINFSGISQELNYALNREVGIHGLAIIWDNLIETSYLYLAGQIANPIILLLVIYWLYNTKIKASYAIFLMIFFSLYAFPLLFGDEAIQARFFYEIPFQIPAAIALTVLRERIGGFLTFAICIWLIVMSFYMVTNFDLVIPEKYL